LKSERSKPPAFEFAAAAFDADGRMLNGAVNDATAEASTGPDAGRSGFFRVRQQLKVPVNAASIRIGVRDKLTDRIGTLEVALPLAPEPQTQAAAPAQSDSTQSDSPQSGSAGTVSPKPN
jgi:hypothetical protein